MASSLFAEQGLASPTAPLTNATLTSTSSSSHARAFFSGAVAGMVANSLLHPFDTVSLRMKVQTEAASRAVGFVDTVKTIFRQEGFRGYFGGLGTTAMSSPIWAAAYFGSYEAIKATCVPMVPENKVGIVYFGAGAMSEILVSGICVPAEVVKCRLQLGRNPFIASGGAIKSTTNFHNTFQAARGIFKAEGLAGFFQGYSACLSVDCAQSGFSFLFYELMKTEYKQYVASKEGKERNCTTPETLVMGAFAGGGAALFSNPLDVICVRLMTQGENKTYKGFRHCLQETVAKEGTQALFKGSVCRILATMPYTGICFGVYEGIKRFFFDGQLDDFDLEEM